MGDYYESHYRDSILGRLRWLRDEVSDKVWTIGFGILDALVDGAKDAVKAGMVSRAPEDAIPYHGRARLLEQTPWETVEAYRLRIIDAWTTWSNMGPASVTVDGEPHGLRATMRLYTGCEDLEVFDCPNDGWPVNGAPDEDLNEDNWSRCTVVIPQPHTWERPVVGPDLVVGPDAMVGITMTQSELSRIRRSFRRHRPAHLIGIDIFVLFDGTAAGDLIADHQASGDYIRIPLGPMPLVGYAHHSMTVGDSCIVGQEFT